MRKFIKFLIKHIPFLNDVINSIKNAFDIKKTSNEFKTQKKKGDAVSKTIIFDNNNVLIKNTNVMVNIYVTSDTNRK